MSPRAFVRCVSWLRSQGPSSRLVGGQRWRPEVWPRGVQPEDCRMCQPQASVWGQPWATHDHAFTPACCSPGAELVTCPLVLAKCRMHALTWGEAVHGTLAASMRRARVPGVWQSSPALALQAARAPHIYANTLEVGETFEDEASGRRICTWSTGARRSMGRRSRQADAGARRVASKNRQMPHQHLDHTKPRLPLLIQQRGDQM